MATRNKFEEMLERLVNEDRDGAEELFHEIVVEKSRDIYESLLEADLEDEEVDEASDEEVDESDDEEVDESDDEDEDDNELDEDFNLDEFEVEADPMDMMGGDPADDMMGAMEPEMGDEDGMDMGDDEDLDDRVEDLEDALQDLKAEFEKMMAGDDEGEEDEDGDMDMGGDDMDMDDEGEDDDNEMESFEDNVEEGKKKMKKSNAEEMREYVEKVSGGGLDGQKIGGDNGANAKSTVAGKNDMGGTTANLRGGESNSEGTQGGLANPSTKEDNAGNVNVPGAKGATKMASQPGHGAEKKSKPETADKGAGSPLNGAPKRAK